MVASNQKVTKLLLILQPVLLNPDLMSKKLEEITAKMDENWKVIILAGPPSKYFIDRFRLSCLFEFRSVPLFGSSKSPLSRIIYLFHCMVRGVEVVKEENVPIITQHDGHLEYGIVAYVVSRITHRKCLIRVNEDTLIPLVFFLKSSGNRLFRHNTILSIVAFTYRKVEYALLKRADWVITHGPMDYKQIKRFNDRITFVPLWVDLAQFRRLDEETVRNFRTKFVPKNDKKILLFVGRLHPEKGVSTLFSALKIIENMPVLLLMVYSSAGYKEEYEKLATDLKISNKILFLGYVPNSELPNYYNSADLCILPSIREEWSNTIMESMACKTPVVATEVGGNPYLIVDGKSGFLVPQNDPWSLAKKIKLALENPALCQHIADTAFNEIRVYGKDRVGESYKKVIKNLITTESNTSHVL